MTACRPLIFVLVTVCVTSAVLLLLERRHTLRSLRSSWSYEWPQSAETILLERVEVAVIKEKEATVELRQEAADLVTFGRRLLDTFPPECQNGSLLDFCSRRPGLPLAVLASGGSVVAVTPEELRLTVMAHALNPSLLLRFEHIRKVLGTPSASDELLQQSIDGPTDSVFLNDLKDFLIPQDKVTIRLCLSQLDGFFLTDSEAFFAKFLVPLIITEDCYNLQNSNNNRVISSELRQRTYFSVKTVFAMRGYSPYDPSVRGNVAKFIATDNAWPAVVHWRKSGF